MGGIASVLGHAALGFEQARQTDLQRQFENEQSRRSQFMSFLNMLATNPNVHPYTQGQAVQMGLEVAQQPWNKPLKPDLNRLFTPSELQQKLPTQQATTPGGLTQGPQRQITLPPPPAPGGVGPVAADQTVTAPGRISAVPPLIAQFTPPPPPASMFMTPEQKTAEMAERTAGVTSAQSGAELQGQLNVLGPAVQKILTEHPEYANDPVIGPALAMAQIGKTAPYGLYRAGMAGQHINSTVAEALADPAWAALVPANLREHPEQTVTLTRDNAGRPMTITSELIPSLVPKDTSGSTTSPAGLTTSTSKTVRPQLTNPPAPQGAGTATAKPAASERKVPPAVASEMDNILMYGMPHKLSPSQELAVAELKKQGINPSVMATTSTMTMADKARAVMPLIARARQLIAADPKALGPLAGRWSELEQKVGSLQGPAKELAGTLTSIYSIAGGMHGWRALRVADEFQKTYGSLSSNAASLNSGLDAMEHTAHVIAQTGYPGMSQPPAPAEQSGAFDWNAHPVVK